MTDMQKFIALYASFGIELVAQKDNEGYTIEFGESTHDKCGGYWGFNTTVQFDDTGTFVKQCFWE